jgi:hypothetical protein
MKPELSASLVKVRTVDCIVYIHLSDNTYWCAPVNALWDRDYSKWEKLAGCPKVLE